MNCPNAPCDSLGHPLPYLNVGSGFDLSIRQLAEMIAQLVGFEGQIKWDTSQPNGTLRNSWI